MKQLPVQSPAHSPPRNHKSTLSPIEEELSELHCSEPGPGELEEMRR